MLSTALIIFNPMDKLRYLSTTYRGTLAQKMSALKLLKIIHKRMMISMIRMRYSFVRDGGVGYLLTLSNQSRQDRDISEIVFEILLVLLTCSRRNEIGSRNDYLPLFFLHESTILECIHEVTTLHKEKENLRFQANEILRDLKHASEKIVLHRFQDVTRAFQLHLMPHVYQMAKASDQNVNDLIDKRKYDISTLVKDMRNHFDNTEIQTQGFRLLTTYIDDELLFPSLDPFFSVDFISVVFSALMTKSSSHLRLIPLMLLLKLTANSNFITYFSEHNGCSAFLAISKTQFGNDLQQLSLWVLSNLCSEGEYHNARLTYEVP
mmetsp:Transcript_7061/g.13313  ORF Transcript_7061/g.13313 Transcript_7061/m.13313 type:complete len:321 (-) Transcript_7061:50-1012(-)